MKKKLTAVLVMLYLCLICKNPLDYADENAMQILFKSFDRLM
jgi:hypothetical protein